MNRRRFIGSLLALPLALAAPVVAKPRLAFHPKAFEMAMDPVSLDDLFYGINPAMFRAMSYPNPALITAPARLKMLTERIGVEGA